MNFDGRWVLVTGASSGLGQRIAEQLAGQHKANLILVARRAQRLDAIKEEIEKAHKVKVATVVADLSKIEDVDRAFEEATDGRDVYAAILNAGITHFGPHEELSWEAFETMLSVNVTSVVRMTRHLVPYLLEKDQGGGVMLVSSLAGVTPIAYQTAYSGTKAFLVNYGCGLHHELHKKNVSVTTFVPGGIATEMTSGERFDTLRGWLMPVDRCAREAISALKNRKYLYTPGLGTRVGTVFMRFLPQKFIAGRVAATYRSALARSGSK